MSIEKQKDLDGLREAGRIVRLALETMKKYVRPGVSTLEVNQIGARVLEQQGARSAPMLVYGFPAEVCISINEEIVHGIPSNRIIEAGDLVKLDIVVEKNGYMADAAITIVVGPASEERQKLVLCAERAFYRALHVARVGNRVNAIGRSVEQVVKQNGFTVVHGLCGHGIGRTIHEDPEVPNEYSIRARQRLTNGLVITIEPMITTGSGEASQCDDGWTIKTADHTPAAHFEHTLVITKGSPLLLTA